MIEVRCASHSLTNGRVRAIKRYTAAHIEWLAVDDATSRRCFYIPSVELGEGRRQLQLRLSPARNNQQVGIGLADDYSEI